MKLSSISFKPVAHITLSDEELRVICECSAAHYDAVCKSVGEEGGFLFGMVNWQANTAAENAERQPVTHSLSWRELDTIAKIVEVGRYLGDEKGKLAFGIGLEIKRIFAALEEHTPKEVTP